MTPASRHRGKQFLTAPPKSSQTDREVGVNAKFATNSTGDPYEDQWKRQHKHYQRANKGSAAVGPGIRAGAAAASPQAAYLPTFGTTVAIPTRRVESYDSYVPEQKSKSATTDLSGRTSRSPGRRRRRAKVDAAAAVDDYEAQERLRRQMVMGLGSGCRGTKVRTNRASTAQPERGSSPRWKPSTLRKSGQSGLFDQHANAEVAGDSGSGSQSLRRAVSPMSARQTGGRQQPFRPGGSRAASRYAAFAKDMPPRSGAQPGDPATAGVAPSPHASAPFPPTLVAQNTVAASLTRQRRRHR